MKRIMVSSSHFQAGKGAREEWILYTPTRRGTFMEEAEEIHAAYCRTGHDHTPLLRFYLSDITNQAPLLRTLWPESRYPFLLLIGQAPADGSKLALAVRSVTQREPTPAQGAMLRWQFSHYTIAYDRHLHGSKGNSYAQTLSEFTGLSHRISPASHQHTLLRTWIYCRDIDNNYDGMVEARKQIFRSWGLGERDHTFASTGIEARMDDPHRLISLHTLSMMGIVPEQLEYMTAPGAMSPATDYGVTFERGTRLIFGDRSHYYISGTASIDCDGAIVAPTDIVGQTRRTLHNITTLLENHQASLCDLKMLTVYLRDPANEPMVRGLIRETLCLDIPILITQGAVCRPGWLIEIEGIAVNDKGHPAYPPLA